MKKVLLLCASHNDLGLINGLKKLGYYIYATGSIPGLIGEKYIDEYIQADYSDKELILEIASKLGLDAICACCNDFGVYTAAYVAEKLGLPGYDTYENTLTLNNKDLFKAFARENGILSPVAMPFSDCEEAIAWCEKQELPLISKAVDLSAGNGITKMYRLEDIRSAIENSFAKSRAKRIVIEPLVVGTQHGFCTFLVNQKVVGYCSNDEYSIANQYRVEIDTFPANGIEKVEGILIEQVEKIAGILKLADGIFHLQYIVDENGPHIIEVMRRAIGNMYGIPASQYNGFDWDYWEARALTGHDCSSFPVGMPQDGHFAYKAVMADKNGKIKSIKVPSRYDRFVFDQCFIKGPGDVIENHMSQPVGLLFMRFVSEEEMHSFLIDNYANDIVEME